MPELAAIQPRAGSTPAVDYAARDIPMRTWLKWRTILLVAAAILCALSRSAAQDKPVFRSAATHVLVDAVVTDRNDKAVTDLTAADFEIRDHGKLQSIADFEHVSIPFGNRPIDLTTPSGPQATVFTNEKPQSDARAFVFMVAYVKPANIIPVKRMFTAFLQALAPHDAVAVLFNGRSDLSQDFTTDPARLVHAFNNLNGALGAPADSPSGWFKTVLTSLASAPQARRAIVYIAEEVPFIQIDQTPRFEHLQVLDEFKRARQLNIPIYTIDPRGLMAPDLGLQGHMEDQSPAQNRALNRGQSNGKQALKVIAENTNGLAFTDNWNVPDAARALVGDNNSYYLLGFYPDPYVADGKFHEIDVRVKRPGLKIRRRQGYQTENAAAPPPPKPLWKMLEGGMPGGDLLLRASTTLKPREQGPAKLQLEITVTYPDFDVALTSDRLDLEWVAIDEDAKEHASGKRTFLVPPGTLRSAGATFTFTELLTLPDGPLTVRAAVGSGATKTMGVVHIPVTIPKGR